MFSAYYPTSTSDFVPVLSPTCHSLLLGCYSVPKGKDCTWGQYCRRQTLPSGAYIEWASLHQPEPYSNEWKVAGWPVIGPNDFSLPSSKILHTRTKVLYYLLLDQPNEHKTLCRLSRPPGLFFTLNVTGCKTIEGWRTDSSGHNDLVGFLGGLSVNLLGSFFKNLLM